MRIVVVSDTHLASRARACLDNWSVVQHWIRMARADLVVHLGDITVDGASYPADLREAAGAFSELGAPVRFLPGNHDIGDNPSQPGVTVESPLDPARLEEYRTLFGDDRWALHLEDWQLIGLNAQLFGTSSVEEERQWAWLEHVTREGDCPLGLMLHKPLFRDSPHEDRPHVRYVPVSSRRRLLAMLSDRRLRFVLSGHAHQSRVVMYDGVEHRWAPSTAFCLPDAMQERIGEKQVGVIVLSLDGGWHRFATFRPEGLRRHNLLDHPALYPGIAALRARLGEAAALL